MAIAILKMKQEFLIDVYLSVLKYSEIRKRM